MTRRLVLAALAIGIPGALLCALAPEPVRLYVWVTCAFFGALALWAEWLRESDR